MKFEGIDIGKVIWQLTLLILWFDAMFTISFVWIYAGITHAKQSRRKSDFMLEEEMRRAHPQLYVDMNKYTSRRIRNDRFKNYNKDDSEKSE